MKLNTVNQSSVTMELRVKKHHMRYQNKGKGQFYEMLSLDLENGLYPTSERSLPWKPNLIYRSNLRFFGLVQTNGLLSFPYTRSSVHSETDRYATCGSKVKFNGR